MRQPYRLLFKTNTLKFKQSKRKKNDFFTTDYVSKEDFSLFSRLSRMQQTNDEGKMIYKTLNSHSTYLFCIIKDRVIIAVT